MSRVVLTLCTTLYLISFADAQDPRLLQTKPRFLSDETVEDDSDSALEELPDVLSSSRRRESPRPRTVDLDRLRERLLQQHEEGRTYRARPATLATSTHVAAPREASALREDSEPASANLGMDVRLGSLLALLGAGSLVWVTRRRG